MFFLLDERRIRILEAQKHRYRTNLTDPDPQHCLVDIAAPFGCLFFLILVRAHT
jgi:hypothetical protein